MPVKTRSVFLNLFLNAAHYFFVVIPRGTLTYEAATLRKLGLARAQFTFSNRYQKLFVNLQS
jgi:hypothetical protein